MGEAADRQVDAHPRQCHPAAPECGIPDQAYRTQDGAHVTYPPERSGAVAERPLPSAAPGRTLSSVNELAELLGRPPWRRPIIAQRCRSTRSQRRSTLRRCGMPSAACCPQIRPRRGWSSKSSSKPPKAAWSPPTDHGSSGSSSGVPSPRQRRRTSWPAVGTSARSTGGVGRRAQRPARRPQGPGRRQRRATRND